MSIERLKEIDSILRAENWYSYCDRYQALPKTWVDLGKALPKLLAFVESYDHWIEMCKQDAAREDLENQDSVFSIASAAVKLHEAREALDK